MKKAIICIISFSAAAYTAWFMQFGSLTANSGALSKTGLRHPVLFAVWGISAYAALLLNGIYIYNKGTKKFKSFFISLGAIAFVGIALTLIFKFDYDLRLQYYLHCAGSLVFSVSAGTAIFFLFLINFKKNLFYAFLTVIIGLILLTACICLFIFKENALIEGLPVIFALISMPCAILHKRKTKEPLNAA